MSVILSNCVEQMSTLLPPDRRQQTFSILARRQPFEILYRLNCDNLCADFQEDLEFRFSWGVTSLISRFVRGNTRHQIALKNSSSNVIIKYFIFNSYRSISFFNTNHFCRFLLHHHRLMSGTLMNSLS